MFAKRRFASLGLALGLMLLPSCVYTHVTVPLDTDLNNTKLGSKQGQSEFNSVLWAVAWGDAGTQAAATDGGLTNLTHMDREILSILGGLYYRQRTIVYGD